MRKLTTIGSAASSVAISILTFTQFASAQTSASPGRVDVTLRDDEAIVRDIAAQEKLDPTLVRSRIKASGDANLIMDVVTKLADFGEIQVTDEGVVVKSVSGNSMGLPKTEMPVRFVKVPRSRKTLRASAELVASQKIPGVHSIAVDVDSGSLTIKSSSGSFPRSIDTGGVPYTTVVEPSPMPASVQGGEELNSPACTTGFAFNPNLVSTASHCPWSYSVNRYTGGTESVTPYAEYCYTETQLMSAPGGSVAQVRANVIKGSGAFAVGDYYYRYGNITNWTNGTVGGDVYYTMPSDVECAGISYWLTQLNGPAAIRGDSGGPVIVPCYCGGFFAKGMLTNTSPQAVPIGTIQSYGFSVKTQ